MQTSVVKSTVDDGARTRRLQFSRTVSMATTISTQFPSESAATDNDAFQRDCTTAALANEIGQALTCRSTSILMSANILAWCQWWCYFEFFFFPQTVQLPQSLTVGAAACRRGHAQVAFQCGRRPMSTVVSRPDVAYKPARPPKADKLQ